MSTGAKVLYSRLERAERKLGPGDSPGLNPLPYRASKGAFPGRNMNRTTVGSALVECVQGDITNQRDMEAVVNAANSELRPGGGVAGAIHRAAGPGLYEECRPLAPILPGEAVITGGHRLPNRYVIHCLGPVYGEDLPSDVLLANCYRNALRLAGERGIRSVAFPAISAGTFGYPIEPAARIAVRTVLEEVKNQPSVREVRFVLFDPSARHVYERVLEEATRFPGRGGAAPGSSRGAE